MLTITIMTEELYDEVKNEFVEPKVLQTLQLEHSLVSLSKWESTWCKPFLDKNNKTIEESLDYIRCMTITKNVDPDVYNHITREQIDIVSNYIDSDMTATKLPKDDKTPSRETVTSEIMYYWMVALNIPFECEKWHLNRLLTLVNVCNIKNQPPKKMNKKDVMRRNAELNAARRKQLNTTG